MERTRFLQHYRVRVRSDGTPYEVDRNGAAVTYEAVDERTAEPVSLKLIPVQSIDAAVREQFEEQSVACGGANRERAVVGEFSQAPVSLHSALRRHDCTRADA